MRVVLILRPSHQGAHSLENFANLLTQTNNYTAASVEIYRLSSRFSFYDIYKLRSMKADIYHITGDVHYLGLFLPSGKVILTIHDIGHYLEMSNPLKKFLYRCIWFELPIKLSRKILFNSSFTKKRVINTFLFKPQSSAVILLSSPLSISENRTTPKASKLLKILQVGTKRNKNLTNLLKAVTKLDFVELIVVGKIGPYDQILITQYNISVKNFLNISEEELKNLYLESDVLFFGSKHEGFGLPILEAQSAHLPVITSNFEPMTEVANKGALYVDPYNIGDIRRKLNIIHTNLSLRKELIDAGLENIKLLSQDAMLKKYFKVYNEVYEESSSNRRSIS